MQNHRPIDPEIATLETALKFAEFWLRFRSASEQRANWYYVALFAGLFGVIGGWEKLQETGMIVGAAVVLLLGLAGLVSGVMIWWAGRFDVSRMNLLTTVRRWCPA